MRTENEIEAMRQRAYAEQGWKDGDREPATCREEEQARLYAEGVEAGLLYALNATSDPFDDGGRGAAGYRGRTGDCAARAAAIATGRPYQEIYDAINLAAQRERPRGGAKRSSARLGVWPRTLGAVLAEHGFTWVPTMTIGSGCRVHLVAGELPAGAIVARLSKHFTAVVDGVVRDDHDPNAGREGPRCVYGYWIRKDPNR